MKNLAIVQIDDELTLADGGRPTAGLAPSKLAERKLAASSVVEWLVRRISEAELVNGVLVVMPDGPQYRELAQRVPLDVPCYFSTKGTPLARLADAVTEYPAEAIVRVSLETPFCDPVLIDRLLVAAQHTPKAEYIGFCREDGCPIASSHIGLFAEWIRCSALARAAREVKSPAHDYQINRSFLDYPELFQLEMLPVPKSLDRSDLRFSVTDDEDWEQLLAMIDALGTEDLEWQEIVRVIDHHPVLRARMARRNETVS